MRLIYLIILIILIWFFKELFEKRTEKFIPIEENKYPLAYQQIPFKDLDFTKNLDKPMPDSLCCKITRKMDKETGKWYYDYKKMKGEKCKPYNNNLPELNKTEYYYVGSKNWDSNDKCSNSYLSKDGQVYLGSCRNLNFECLDFVDKKTCAKYPGYTWSNKTCMENIKFPVKYKESKHYLLNQ